MREKLKSFIIMALGIFVVNYFIFGDRNIGHIVYVSVVSGLTFALIEGYMKRVLNYFIKKIPKRFHNDQKQ